MRYFYLSLFSVLFFAGCGGSNIQSEWICPPDQPDNCNSVHEGDQIALNKLRSRGFVDGVVGEGVGGAEGKFEGELPEVSVKESVPESKVLKIKRVDEELAAIWIGAFVDEAGNYHPPAELYIVVRPARWAQ